MGKITLRCPECAEKFSWDSGKKWPDYCPLKDCGAFVGLKDENEVAVPFISLKGNREADRLVRAMETGSEVRAKQAAEMTGGSVSDFSDLKITDMKDNLREGDVAAPEVVSVNGISGSFGGGMAPGTQLDPAAMAAMVRSGPAPSVGSGMVDAVRSVHSRNGNPVHSMPTELTRTAPPRVTTIRRG